MGDGIAGVEPNRAVATGTASTAMAVPLFDQVPNKFERVILFYNGTSLE